MVITLASIPLSSLSDSEKMKLAGMLGENYKTQIEGLLTLKKSAYIDGWVMRMEGDILYTTIFYQHLSRTLQRIVFGFQQNISDILEDKKISMKVIEDSNGEEILVFPGGKVIYDTGSINRIKDMPGGKSFYISQNELNFLKNGDIRSVQEYLKGLYNI